MSVVLLDIKYTPDDATYDTLNDTMKELLKSSGYPVDNFSKVLALGQYVPYCPENPIDQNLIAYAMDNLVNKRGIVLKENDHATALEALVAIAAHYVDVVINGGDYVDGSNEYVAKIFWGMMENLGLTLYSDDKWEEPENRFTVVNTYIIFAGKDLDNNGKGSPFYLHCTENNLPINFVKNPYWVQMDWWYDVWKKD